MQLSVKGRNLEVTDAIRAYAEEKVQRMTRYLENIVSGTVYLSVEKHQQIAEVTLRVRDLTIRAEESTDDLYSSIDLVAEKLERQILRYKERIAAHVSRSGGREEWEAAPAPPAVEDLRGGQDQAVRRQTGRGGRGRPADGPSRAQLLRLSQRPDG